MTTQAPLPDRFWEAILSGNLEEVQVCIAAGANPDEFHNRIPPLMSAASQGRLDIVKLLVEAGANVHCMTNRTLENGAWVGFTLVHQAVVAEIGPASMVSYLIEEGASVDTQDKTGRTPLSWAAGLGKLECAACLLDAGAEIDMKCKELTTPLMRAVSQQHLEMVDLLVARGANINARSLTGSPLHAAVRSARIETVDKLIGYGADLEAEGPSKATPLCQAASLGCVHLIEPLLEAGANPDARDSSGYTSLMLLANKGHELGPLLRHGASVDLKIAGGWTALMFAAASGHERCVRTLLEAGADTTPRGAQRMTAAELARQSGHASIVALFEYWQLNGGKPPSSESPTAHRRRL